MWCTLAYIAGICWGNCTKHFHVKCSSRAWKFRLLILGVFSPNILEPKNIVFKFEISRLYCKYLDVLTSYYKSEKALQTAMYHLYWDLIWCTLVRPKTAKNRTAVRTHSRSIICLVVIISPSVVETLNPSEISHSLENVYRVLIHHHLGKMSAKNWQPKTFFSARFLITLLLHC